MVNVEVPEDIVGNNEVLSKVDVVSDNSKVLSIRDEETRSPVMSEDIVELKNSEVLSIANVAVEVRLIRDKNVEVVSSDDVIGNNEVLSIRDEIASISSVVKIVSVDDRGNDEVLLIVNVASDNCEVLVLLIIEVISSVVKIVSDDIAGIDKVLSIVSVASDAVGNSKVLSIGDENVDVTSSAPGSEDIVVISEVLSMNVTSMVLEDLIGNSEILSISDENAEEVISSVVNIISEDKVGKSEVLADIMVIASVEGDILDGDAEGLVNRSVNRNVKSEFVLSLASKVDDVVGIMTDITSLMKSSSTSSLSSIAGASITCRLSRGLGIAIFITEVVIDHFAGAAFTSANSKGE